MMFYCLVKFIFYFCLFSAIFRWKNCSAKKAQKSKIWTDSFSQIVVFHKIAIDTYYRKRIERFFLFRNNFAQFRAYIIGSAR